MFSLRETHLPTAATLTMKQHSCMAIEFLDNRSDKELRGISFCLAKNYNYTTIRNINDYFNLSDCINKYSNITVGFIYEF